MIFNSTKTKIVIMSNKSNDSNSSSSIFELAELAMVGFSVFGAVKETEFINKLITSLNKNPTNPDVHKAFLEGLKKIKNPNPIDITRPTYHKILNVLLNHPKNDNVGDLVLEVGKWHFAAQKPSKQYTNIDLQQVKQRLTAISDMQEIRISLKDDDEFLFDEAVQIIAALDNQTSESDPISLKYDEEKISFLNRFILYLLNRINLYPDDKKYHNLLMDSVKKVLDIDSLQIYNSVLDIFQSSSSQQSLKILVLEVGRWHFGKQRFWGKAKEADEQTIMNDIFVRSK